MPNVLAAHVPAATRRLKRPEGALGHESIEVQGWRCWGGASYPPRPIDVHWELGVGSPKGGWGCPVM